MATVHAAFGPTDAEAAFGEVDGIADAFAHAVIGHPFDEVGVHTTLEDEVFDEATDFIVGKGSQDAGAQAKAAAGTTGDVVFSAAFPGGELAGGAYAAFAWIQAQEDFTEGEYIVERLAGHEGVKL